jgi:hypothetical protein
MTERPEYHPGESAPAYGTYELINIFGRPIGVSAEINHGEAFPAAPIGHFWRIGLDEAVCQKSWATASNPSAGR